MINQQIRNYRKHLAYQEYEEEIILFGRDNLLVSYGIARYVETLEISYEHYRQSKELDRLTHGFARHSFKLSALEKKKDED